MGRDAGLLQPSPQVFERFLAPGNSWVERERLSALRANKRFVQGEENNGVRVAKDRLR